MPPKGQACMHILQRMHLPWSTIMAPVASSRLMAPTGQAFMQKASSHWTHIIGTETSSSSQVYTVTRDLEGT